MVIQNEYTSIDGVIALYMLIVIVVGILLAVLYAIYDTYVSNPIGNPIGTAITIVIAIAIGGAGIRVGIKNRDSATTQRVKAIFEEKVDMNEILKKYEIISNEGKIVTLELIETEIEFRQ